MKFLKSILALAIVSPGFYSCNTDDPIIPNEDELITTVIYTLTPIAGGDEVVFSFKDLDGDGSNPPEIINGILAANSSYTGVLSILNETETPPEDIGEEVEDESDEHQFFLLHDGTLEATISYEDTDVNGNPLGLETSLETGDASTGELIITLKHQPKKPNNGTLTDAGGITDIEVKFTVVIQ
jgi:hypothetical protein